ncbi:hypothetical protein ACQPZJ_29910 [Actinoplanes sp. CA-054009]
MHQFPFIAQTVGHLLRSADDQKASVKAVRLYQGPQHRLNLTHASTHTYYVLAGNTPVLVHNSDTMTVDQFRGLRSSHPTFEEKANPLKSLIRRADSDERPGVDGGTQVRVDVEHPPTWETDFKW